MNQKRSTNSKHYKEFHSRGYTLAKNIFTKQTITRFHHLTDKLQNIRRQLRAENSVAVIPDIFEHEPKFLDVFKNQKLLVLLEQVFGPNIELVRAKIYWKPQEVGQGRVLWHQDFVANPHTHAGFGTAMIYLNGSTKKTGCLSMIPESHRLGILSHYNENGFTWNLTEFTNKIDWSKAADIVAQAGDVSVHHSLTLHSSHPNNSEQPRKSLALMVRPTDCIQIGGSIHKTTGTLVMGKYTDTIRCEFPTIRIPKRTYSTHKLKV